MAAAARLAVAAGALLAAVARADYMLAHSYSGQRTCAGTADQLIAQYLGCSQAPDGSISYLVHCLNQTAFSVDYFNGAACAGPVIHTAPVSWPAGCVAGNATRPSTSTVCMSGSYVAPTNAIDLYLFGPPNKCPLEGLHFYAVVSMPKSCLSNPDGGAVQSFIYGCNTVNVTGTPYASKDCTGAPLSAPMPVMSLGCSVSPYNDGPTFVTCGSKPPAALEAPAAAPPAAAAAAGSAAAGNAGDAVRASVLEGAARAAERAAKVVRETVASAMRESA